jgi:hypothetical protein
MRLDCLLSNKINISDYIKTFNSNNVKLICRDVVLSNRVDHNRDWNMGIISKNIDNIYTFVLTNYEILNPNDNELKNLLELIKCNSIFKLYQLPLPKIIENNYKNKWNSGFNKEVYSFNTLIAPLSFEDTFYLKIIR